MENEKYDEAVEAFDQAILYEPEYPEFLVPTQLHFTKQKILSCEGNCVQDFSILALRIILKRWNYI